MHTRIFTGPIVAMGFATAGIAAVSTATAEGMQWGGQGYDKDGMYIRGEGAWSDLGDTNYATGAGRVDTEYDSGYLVGGAVGMKQGSLRYEGELLHQEADVDRQSLNGAGLAGPGGKTKFNAAMANAYWDIGTGRIKPYVGGGVGAAHIKADGHSGGGVALADDGDTVLAYQGMAGVSYDLNPCWSVNAEYRYIGAQDAEITTAGSSSNDMSYDSNNLLVGLSYKF